MAKIKVLYKKPYEQPKVVEIEDTYESIRDLIGGYIEFIDIPEVEGVEVILDEEGKLKGLDPNFDIPEYFDTIVGPALIVGSDGFGGTISLTADQVSKVLEYIYDNEY